MSFISIAAVVGAVLLALILTPFILQLGGAAASQAQETFNYTIAITDQTSVNVGGVAALIITLAMVFLPLYIIERVMRG